MVACMSPAGPVVPLSKIWGRFVSRCTIGLARLVRLVCRREACHPGAKTKEAVLACFTPVAEGSMCINTTELSTRGCLAVWVGVDGG